MKLTKISLATLVALGAFSSVASATPLEEAIKNVDMSGFVRYRYDSVRAKDADKNLLDRDIAHKFRITTDFKAAFDDNFFGVLGIRYNSVDGSSNTFDKTDADGKFGVYQLYLGYKAANTTITAGKQVIGSFFTDDEVGTGIKIVDQNVEGLTLAAIAFDALDYDTYEVDGGLLLTADQLGYKPGNLYGVAAMGSFDPVAFQLWYATATDLVDIAAIELSGDFAVNDNVSFGVKAQYAHANADKKAKAAFGSHDYSDGNFYAGELSTSLFGADLSAGYIGWSVKNKGMASFSLEDQGQYINPGELFSGFADYTGLQGKGSFWFLTAGYTFDEKYSVGVDYINGTKKWIDPVKLISSVDKTRYQEIVGRLGYAYSKKLEFESFYAYATEKTAGEKEKETFFRFQAKYSF